MTKKCPFCGHQRTKKCGKNRSGKQRYFCSNCRKYFQRQKYKTVSKSSKIWYQYVWERQTLSTLSKRYNRSVRWLRKQISDVQINFQELAPCPVVIEADATFFNRYEGVCIFHAPKINKVLTYAFIESETALIYKTLRNNIERRGFTVLAAVIDGRKGIREVFADVPVQMCQYHQLMILRRYLTMNPRLEAGRELRTISKIYVM